MALLQKGPQAVTDSLPLLPQGQEQGEIQTHYMLTIKILFRLTEALHMN